MLTIYNYLYYWSYGLLVKHIFRLINNIIYLTLDQNNKNQYKTQFLYQAYLKLPFTVFPSGLKKKIRNLEILE